MIRERKLLRLSGYNYATPGAYFITACVNGRMNDFGEIDNGLMKLNEYGKIVERQWKWLFDQYEYLKMGEYCVMPNHFHGIIWITLTSPKFSPTSSSLKSPMQSQHRCLFSR